MQLRRRPSEHAEVATEALNDIMFFLLLFFLIISTLATPNAIQVALPKANQSKQMSKQPVVVSVNKDLQFFVAGNRVKKDDLETTLQGEMSKLTEPTIVLRLDKGVKVQELVDILAIGERLKVKMVLASAPAN